MGTRNLTCVVLDGEYKVAQYGQWDGYPEGQGWTIVSFIKNFDEIKFKKQLRNLKIVSEEEYIERYKEFGVDLEKDSWVDIGVSEKFKKKYPHLNRDCGANILNLIHYNDYKEVQLNLEFAKNSLFNEWTYVLDLDEGFLEVYEGFNHNPLDKNERFYFDGYVDIKEYDETQIYYPVRFLTKFSLDELKWFTKEDFVNRINELIDDEGKD